IEEAIAHAAVLRPRRDPPKPASLARHLRMDDDGRLRWRWDPKVIGGVGVGDSLARLEEAAAKVKLPTLILRGGESMVVSHDTAERLKGLIEGAELVDVQGAGHLV